MKLIDTELARARRIAVRAQLLDGSATSMLETVRRLGFLQMDPISTVAPPQHLVLFSRLGRFDTAELDRLLWEERKLVEYDAFIYPVEDMPLLRARMARRKRGETPGTRAWVGEFLVTNAKLRRHILRELGRNGPMLSRDLQHDGVPRGLDHRWWGDRPLRLMLEILAGRGEVGVAGRAGKQRLWDIGERVFPPSETMPWREAQRELEHRRQRSLGVWRERGVWKTHPDIPDDPVPNRIAFLSPFDRLVHDRDRAEHLWGFTTGSRCTCRRRGASTATTCCRSSAATGSSAGSTSSTCARRRRSASTASGGRTACGPFR